MHSLNVFRIRFNVTEIVFGVVPNRSAISLGDKSRIYRISSNVRARSVNRFMQMSREGTTSRYRAWLRSNSAVICSSR